MKQVNFDQLLQYAKRRWRSAATRGVYIILLLFYAYNGPDVPSWAKKIIIGSFAYVVAPIDSIPDLTPILGMTDDMGVLAFSLVTIACYINDEIRTKAADRLRTVFKEDVDAAIISEVNSWL